MIKVKPTKKQEAEFLYFVNLLNKNTFDSVKEYGEIMAGVMNDLGVSHDFNFREMSMSAVIKKMENRIDELKSMQFECFELAPAVKEITRPKGS